MSLLSASFTVYSGSGKSSPKFMFIVLPVMVTKQEALALLLLENELTWVSVDVLVEVDEVEDAWELLKLKLREWLLELLEAVELEDEDEVEEEELEDSDWLELSEELEEEDSLELWIDESDTEAESEVSEDSLDVSSSTSVETEVSTGNSELSILTESLTGSVGFVWSTSSASTVLKGNMEKTITHISDTATNLFIFWLYLNIMI